MIDFEDMPPLISRDRLLAERDTLRVLLSPDVAPKGTEGWVYRIEKINPRTVKIAPLQGGGKIVTTDLLLLVEATPEQVAAAAEAPVALDLHVGTVVRLEGPRWTQPRQHLYVVTATHGLTEISVARLGGERGRFWSKLPRSLVVATIAPQGLAAAMADDEAFA